MEHRVEAGREGEHGGWDVEARTQPSLLMAPASSESATDLGKVVLRDQRFMIATQLAVSGQETRNLG